MQYVWQEGRITWRVELWASCSRLSFAPSVMKPFWKIYVFRMEASTTYKFLAPSASRTMDVAVQ